MSGTLSPLASAMMGNGPVGPQAIPAVPQRGVSAIPPLASLLAPNAMDLQRANPSLPWYAVPGMFGPPPAPPQAPQQSGPSQADINALVQQALRPQPVMGPDGLFRYGGVNGDIAPYNPLTGKFENTPAVGMPMANGTG